MLRSGDSRPPPRPSPALVTDVGGAALRRGASDHHRLQRCASTVETFQPALVIRRTGKVEILAQLHVSQDPVPVIDPGTRRVLASAAYVEAFGAFLTADIRFFLAPDNDEEG